MTSTNSRIQSITDTIRERSVATRQEYLARCAAASHGGTHRSTLGCTNMAHAAAAVPVNDKLILHAEREPNLGIVTAYNDMLSAHQPFEAYPAEIKKAVRESGATAQVAGGVPAMCDGVTQGRPGMELSLFSRDVIAMSTAVALSHNMFDAAVYLGVCDKIVPGLLIGALSFGHIPAVFIPAGPMTSGVPNKEKARTRQRFAEGKATREELLESESGSYHGAGTCTFYGTANSNQMLMEFLGLHLPGAAFVNPGTELRTALTAAAAQRAIEISQQRASHTPICDVVDERAVVNALVGLMATGGSTNHTLHLVAIARAAGILINWDDFNALAKTIPLLTHIYPSGSADVNEFHAAGGLALVIRELLDAGLLNDDVTTVAGEGGLRRYTEEPCLDNGKLGWRDGPAKTLDPTIVAGVDNPFLADGGLVLLDGNIGRAIIKISAVQEKHRIVKAPAVVFDSQEALIAAFEEGSLEKDFIAVIRGQGPRSNGMPELHRLTPILGVLLDRGFAVALVTDGRMSGASGKVPAAIHVSPESALGGAIGQIRDGDVLELDSVNGTLKAMVDADEWQNRDCNTPSTTGSNSGMGRELFANMRGVVSSAEEGACTLFPTSVSGEKATAEGTVSIAN